MTSPPDLFSAALVVFAKSIPVYSFILSYHLFCLSVSSFSYFHYVLAKLEDLKMWSNHLSFRFWAILISLVQYHSSEFHLIDERSCLELFCQGLGFRDIQKHGYDKEATKFIFDPRDII